MKKLIKNLILFMVFILVLHTFNPIYAYADIVLEGKEVEEGKEEDTRTNVKVYNIAAKVDDNTYELSNDFIDCGYTIDNITNATASELTEISEKIGEYATKSNAEFYMINEQLCLDITVQIEMSGAYLVLIEEIEYGEYLYTFQPIICFANIEEDVRLNPKVYLSSGSYEEETTEVPPISVTPPQPSTPEFPNTGFNIVPVYILVFIGVITIIIAFGIGRRNVEHKKYSYSMYALGVVMICVSAFMMGRQYILEKNAVETMDVAKDTIKQIIIRNEEKIDNAEDKLLLEIIEDEEEPMSVCEVDGSKYIGILEIPSLSLELPIGYDCQESTLKCSPGRFSGQVDKETFVIGAHHYGSQFGYINQLIQGDEIRFTNLEGHKYNYKVASMTVVEPTQVEEVCNSGYDLALFTCNYNASKRIIVYCQKYE